MDRSTERALDDIRSTIEDLIEERDKLLDKVKDLERDVLLLDDEKGSLENEVEELKKNWAFKIEGTDIPSAS